LSPDDPSSARKALMILMAGRAAAAVTPVPELPWNL